MNTRLSSVIGSTSNKIVVNSAINVFIVLLFLGYSEDLKHHYNLYQLLLFHFQNKVPEKFFEFIEDNLKQVHPLFQTVLKALIKDKEKIVNVLQLPFSNSKLEVTINLIELNIRKDFDFSNFENFRKYILNALNIKMEKTKIVLSRC